MPKRKLIYGALAALCTLNIVIGSIFCASEHFAATRVIFLDVGQGDAILISSGKNQILIDGGRDGKRILEKLGEYIPFWDRNIEAVIATHPDQDHIGGLIEVFENYKVKVLFKTNASSESQTFRVFKEASEKETVNFVEAKKGVWIKFPGGEFLEIIYPSEIFSETVADSNDSSVVAKFYAGKSVFLLTGDISQKTEEKIMTNKIAADVLKVSHHGSKYSTKMEFLEAVKPKEAVISVGKNNAYGHPAAEVIERLLENGIKIRRTDEEGDIAYYCKTQSEVCAAEPK